MKKIYSVLLFVACALIGFFVSKGLLRKEDPVVIIEEPIPSTPKDEVPNVLSQDTITKDQTSSEPTPAPIIEKDKEETKTETKTENKPDAKTETKPSHVNISHQEMKSLIQTGKYARDLRIAKNYKITYTDVSDDDMDNLQQNFTYIQQRVEYETWRDFEVVGIDYDEQGKVNDVTIKPIY